MNLISDYKLFKRFFHYLKPYRGSVQRAALAIPVSVAVAILVPWLIMKVVDSSLAGGRPEYLMPLVLAMLAALFAGYAADSFYMLFLQRAGQLAIYSMRRDLFLHTLRLPRRFFDQTPAGATLTRLTSDFEALGDTMAAGILSLFTDFLKIIGLLIFLSFISLPLTGLLLLICVPSAFLTRLIHGQMRRLYQRSWGALSSSTGFLQECLKGVATIQLYNAEEKVLKRYGEKNSLFYHAQKNANISESLLSTMVEGLISLATALILLAGGHATSYGTLTIGAVVAFINTVPRIFVPIRDFTFQLATMQRALAALDHIEDLFKQDPDADYQSARGVPEQKVPVQDPDADYQSARGVPAQKEHLTTPKNAAAIETFQTLEFENVSFRYSPDGPYVLRNVSFKLRKGERIAIVGPTGSGKSTIIRILNRAYGPYEGSVRVNGIELSSITQKQLLKIISLMPQDAYLFNETAAFNIGLERAGVTGQKIVDAARYVHADTFIRNLPGGYDFMITEHGSNMSAGQSQLLCFARSIAAGSDLIILDEATSSVDSITESLIEKAISHVFEQKTVIAIAHRLSTIRSADTILVLDQGHILESGTHETLVTKGGLYSKLVKSMADVPSSRVLDFD